MTLYPYESATTTHRRTLSREQALHDVQRATHAAELAARWACQAENVVVEASRQESVARAKNHAREADDLAYQVLRDASVGAREAAERHADGAVEAERKARLAAADAGLNIGGRFDLARQAGQVSDVARAAEWGI